MTTIIVIIIVIGGLSITLLFRKFEHTWYYLIFCAAIAVYFFVETILKARVGLTRVALLMGCVTLLLIWRTIMVAVEMRKRKGEGSSS